MLSLVICNFCHATESAITLIVPFAAGGPTDTVARIVQQGLVKEMGRAVILMYKPGAGGIIGTNYAIEQKNNGTVLLFHSSAFFINHVLNKPGYNLTEEFKLISHIGYHPFVLIANERFDYQNLKEWSALKGKRFNFGNGGQGTAGYVANKIFETYFPNIEFTHVSYSKGMATLASDIMSGTLDLAITQAPLANQLINTSKVQPLAVASVKRLDTLPNVPTFREVGIHNLPINSPHILFATNTMNQSELLRIRAAMNRVLEDSDIRAQLKIAGVERESNIDTDNFIAQDLVKYEKLLKNIK